VVNAESSGDVQSWVTAIIRAGWRKFSDTSYVSSTMWKSSVIEAERSFV